jgi:hypothetical protein
LAPAALGACGAWRLWRLAPAAPGACGAWRLRRLVPATLGAWRLRRLALHLAAFFCLGWPLDASRGPNEPKSVFSGCLQSDIIAIDHFWGRWTLPTCSNMPYTTSIPTIVCLVWPLEASRGQNELKCVFSGCPQSDIIGIDHFWGRWTLPTCSNMPYTTSIPTIVCLVWPLDASKAPKRPK